MCVYNPVFKELVTSCFLFVVRGQEQLGWWHERWCAILGFRVPPSSSTLLVNGRPWQIQSGDVVRAKQEDL